VTVSQANVIDKIKTNTSSGRKFFFFWKSCLLRGKVEKNIAEPSRLQMRIWYMCIAWWIPIATNIHTGYVALIAFPQQQWWREPASLVLLYVHCLSCYLPPYPCDEKKTCLCFRQTLFILCTGNAYQIKLWQLFSGFFHMCLTVY